MKHVFSVHSPITFLAAHAVVEHLQLALEEVVILSNGYQVPLEKYNVHPFLSNLHQSWWQKLANLNTPVQEDRYLNSILDGKKFTAYIDLMSYNQVAFITHPQCRNFHFIEEGNSSYRKGDDLDTVTWNWFYRGHSFRVIGWKARLRQMIEAVRWSARGYNHRFLSVPFSFNSFAFMEGVTFFGFSSLAYPDVPEEKKVVLPVNFSDADLQTLAAGIKLENAIIWVDGSNSSFTRLPEVEYHQAIEHAVKKRWKELSNSKIYLKLRPGIADLSKNFLYRHLTEKGLQPEVLPNNLVLEAVFINAENCTVIGNLSSALFYASIFGHRSYSIYHLYETKVATIFDNMPGFWEKVKKI